MFKVRYFTHTIFEISRLQLSFQIDRFIKVNIIFIKKIYLKKKLEQIYLKT